MPATARSHLVRLGPFQLDLKAGELRKEGHRLRLQEQPFRILQMLVERARAAAALALDFLPQIQRRHLPARETGTN